MRILLRTILFLAATGCASNQPVKPSPIAPLERSEYRDILKRNTVKANEYSGFHQTFQADVTILNSEVQSAVVRERAHFLEWDERRFQMEREKSSQEASAYSKFFLRFFSPEKDYDDLDRTKSIWKVYLEYNGNRFEGKVRKMNEKLVELQTLFMNMDRFSTPYEVTFNIPMSTIERGNSRVSLTSSLGTAEFSFAPVK